jgi:hypothetical protein
MQETYSSGPSEALSIAIVLAMIAVVLFIALAIQAVICYFVAEHYKIIPAGLRKMEPGQVWLMMIPLFNLYWAFPVFLGLSESYQAAFAARGRTDVGDCSRQIALWYCICVACSVIPCLNYISGPASLVLLIIYLIKISEYKKQLLESPGGPFAAPSV